MLKRWARRRSAELFSDIPAEFALKRRLAIPEGQPEATVRREVDQEARARTGPGADALCFLGGGVWPHYIPAAVESILSRQEFYTSYTPYQPEISQGMLQALFEYQSLMCDLLGMQACNSSMYDWALGRAEAVRMVAQGEGQARVPGRRDRRAPAARGHQDLRRADGTDAEDGKPSTGGRARSTRQLSRRQPGRRRGRASISRTRTSSGSIEEGAGGGHRRGPPGGRARGGRGRPDVALGLRNPGSYGADVVVGEGQPLGIPMNFGGPHVGIFAVRDMSLARSMPGRLIGMTTTRDGNERAFCMVLQTREQHIRREHASSNICTNQALLALAAACYLALLGKERLQPARRGDPGQLALCGGEDREVEGVGLPLFEGPFFKEFAVGYERAKATDVYEKLAREGDNGRLPAHQAIPRDRRGGRLLRHGGALLGRHLEAGAGAAGGGLSLAEEVQAGALGRTAPLGAEQEGEDGVRPSDGPEDRGVEAARRELLPANMRTDGGQAPGAGGAPGPEALQQALADELLGRVWDVPPRAAAR